MGLATHVRLFLSHRVRASARFPACARLLGLLPVRRAPGPAKCFQKPGGRRLRGAPRRRFPRVGSVEAVGLGVRRRGPCFSGP